MKAGLLSRLPSQTAPKSLTETISASLAAIVRRLVPGSAGWNGRLARLSRRVTLPPACETRSWSSGTRAFAAGSWWICLLAMGSLRQELLALLGDERFAVLGDQQRQQRRRARPRRRGEPGG